MKSNENNNEVSTRELVRGVRHAGREYLFSLQQYRSLCLASMDLMLASGRVYWGEDFVESLEKEKNILQRDFNETGYVVNDDPAEDFVDEELTSAEDSNRHTKALNSLCDAVGCWPIGDIENLCSKIQDSRIEDIFVSKQVA